MKSTFKISIIGAGRLGGALAIALAKKHFAIESLFARNVETAEKIAEMIEPPPRILSAVEYSEITADLILITTQDSEIEKVASDLSEKLASKPIVFHTSGALSSEILKELKSIGCPVGSIHPLISISNSKIGAERFANAYFCVEGDKSAIEAAEKIVETLGGKSFSIATEYKTLYHASAVTACGHLVAVVDAAIELLRKCGLNEKAALKIFQPLIESTVENLKDQTPAQALTGTFARADVGTFEKHLEILRETVSEEALEIYLLLGQRSLKLAEERGANPENIEKIRGQILIAKKNLK